MIEKFRSLIARGDVWLETRPGMLIAGSVSVMLTIGIALVTWLPAFQRDPGCAPAVSALARDLAQNDADLRAADGDRTDAVCPVYARRAAILQRADDLRRTCAAQGSRAQLAAELTFYRRLADETCGR